MKRTFTKYPQNYIKAASSRTPAICKWVKQQIQSGAPIELPIKLDIVETGWHNGTKGVDYIRVRINGIYVTPEIAKTVKLPTSKALYTSGCIAYPYRKDYSQLVKSVQDAAESAGYPDMFDSEYDVTYKPFTPR